MQESILVLNSMVLLELPMKCEDSPGTCGMWWLSLASCGQEDLDGDITSLPEDKPIRSRSSAGKVDVKGSDEEEEYERTSVVKK